MRLKRYLWHHAAFLLFVAFFALYGYVMIGIFENRLFHCFMHDVAHLYCPLCGGTRAFLLCLRLDPAALIFNPAAILWGMLFAVLDVRALVLILKGREGELFPEWLFPFTVCFFGTFGALRNVLAFFGVDPVGDIAPFWTARLTPLSATVASLMLCAVTVCLCGGILHSDKKKRTCLWYLLALLLVPLLAVLYTPWLLLLYLPLLAGVGLWHWYRTRPFSLTVIKYGETTIPLRMAFADCPGREDPVPISLLIFLIETRGRKILVDAGCDTMPRYDVKHHISPAEALRHYGVEPTDITDLILTHAHSDHAAATPYFTNATVHIAQNEIERAMKRGYLPEGCKLSPFKYKRRIAGVTVRVWGGHSEGSSIVTFARGGREYVIAGDECYSKRCLTEGRPTGASYNKERSRAFVQVYGSGAYTVFLSHDPDILPGENGHLTLL